MRWQNVFFIILMMPCLCFGLAADINRDGIVNFGDLAILAGEWMETDTMGNIAVFDGISGRVSVGHDNSLDAVAGDFSVGGWFDTFTNGKTLLSKCDTFPFKGYHLYVGSGFQDVGKLVFIFSDGISQPVSVMANKPAAGQHHIFATIDRDGNGVLYIDGEAVKTQAVVGNTTSISTSEPFVIGAGSDVFYAGTADDIRFYQLLVTAGDVAKICNGMKGILGSGEAYGLPVPAWRCGFDVVSGNTIQGIKADGFELNATKTAGVTLVEGGVPFVIDQITAIDLANAVVTSLNEDTYSMNFTAVMSLFPFYEIKDLSTLRVTVMPKNLEITRVTRSSSEFNYEIDIAVQKVVDLSDNSSLINLAKLALSIASNFKNKIYSNLGAACFGQNVNPIFSTEHIQPPSVFTSIVTLKFKIMA